MQRVKMEDWIAREAALPCLTREKLEALQLERLNSLLKRLRARGGRYASLPSGLGSLKEIERLPFTDCSMLSSSPGQFLSCSQSQVSRVISQTTSGTSGRAKRVFYSERDLENTVDFFASGISEMLSAGEKCLIAFPFSGPGSLGDLIARAVEKLGALPLSAGACPDYGRLCAFIEERQPQSYIGFPVPLLSVMRLYSGYFPIKSALISGDACPDSVWEALSSELTLFPHYGSRETALGGAVCCQAHEGMHLRENHIIAEIVDSSGRPLPEGCFGELVLTTIGMEAMPLLRYRTGDITRLLPGPCPCGGVTRRIDSVRRMPSGPADIQSLDSLLFSLPRLTDYSLSYDGVLHFKLSSTGSLSGLRELIQQACPDMAFDISLKKTSLSDKPAYSGKRYIIENPQETIS